MQELPQKYVNTFNTTQAAAINSKLYECIERSILGKIQYPPDLSSSMLWQDFVHITWSTQTLGVIDDIFIQTYLNETADPMYSVLNIQSQLRMGISDFDANYNHVYSILKCMNSNLKSLVNVMRPCSL